MKEVSIIGVDLAKQVFQLHGATSEGEAVFRKKLSRKQFLAFMQSHAGGHRCNGGLCDRSPLGAHIVGPRTRCAPNRPEVRQAVCKEPEKRHGGCRGYRRGRQPADYAFR